MLTGRRRKDDFFSTRGRKKFCVIIYILLACVLVGTVLTAASAFGKPFVQGNMRFNCILDKKDGTTQQMDVYFNNLKFQYVYSMDGEDIYMAIAGSWRVAGTGTRPVCNGLLDKDTYKGTGLFELGLPHNVVLKIPTVNPIGQKANIDFGVADVSIHSVIYPVCDKPPKTVDNTGGYGWADATTTPIVALVPKGCFKVKGTNRFFGVLDGEEFQAWLEADLYTRLAKMPPSVKPASPKVRAVDTGPDPLAPLVVEPTAADPNGIDGSIILAPLVPQSQSVEESLQTKGIANYGKANFTILKNRTSKRVNIKLSAEAMAILNRKKPLSCTAVIKATDMLGNTKTTRTPLTILPPL